MCGLLAFKKTLHAYLIFLSMFALSSFLWWICLFCYWGASLGTIFSFSTLFIILLRLSWDGCTMTCFFNIFTFCSSILTSSFKSSFSLPIASSQDSTTTCSTLKYWLLSQRASISILYHLSQPLLVEALVILGVFEGFGVLTQRALNYTLSFLWVFCKRSYKS
jgi:hypothetical protein